MCEKDKVYNFFRLQGFSFSAKNTKPEKKNRINE